MNSSYFLQRYMLRHRLNTAPCSVCLGRSLSHCTRAAPLHLHPSVSSRQNKRVLSDYGIGSINIVRSLSTKITTDSNDSFLDDEWKAPDDYEDSNRFVPRNEHQRKLIEYTKSLISTEDRNYVVGSYPITDIIQISNCIDSWIASGEHRYVGAQQAELLVKRLIMERGGGRSLVKDGKMEFGGGNPEVSWDMYHLESLILWLNGLYHGKDFLDRILSIMASFEEEYSDSIEIPYKSIVSILCKCDTGHASVAAEQILHQYETKALSGSSHFDLSTTETYNNLITSWVNADQSFYPSGYTPAYQHSHHPPANVLSEILYLYKQNPDGLSRIRPDRITFNMVISSLSNHQRREQLTASSEYLKEVKGLAFNLLKSMIEVYKEGNHLCAPDIVTFSTVLNMLQREPSCDEDGHRACEILNDMIELSSSNSYEHDVIPAAKHFNVGLGLIARQKQIDRSVVEQAKELVKKMTELAEQEEPRITDVENTLESFSSHYSQPDGNSSETSSEPDVVTYNTLINIAANAEMPEVAEEILNEMIERANSGESSVKPNIISFNTVLNAWSKSKKSIIGTKSSEILNTMQKLSERGDFHVKPDNVSLTTVINSLIKSSRMTRAAPVQAEAIIQKMNENKDDIFRPDTITYTSLIKCWSESGRPKAASRAEYIIELLHKRFDEGHRECKPDSRAYNVALNAIAKSGVSNCAQRAQALLERMKSRYYAGDVDIAPNIYSFSTVINAWSKSGDPDAGRKAEELLETMIKLHESGLNDMAPNTVTFSSCINAWSRSKHKDAGRRATALLKQMDELDNKGYINIKPNIYSFTSAIEAWSNSSDPNCLDEASAIFELAKMRYKSGEEDSKPTTQTYNAMFRAIGQSPLEKAKHVRAEQLFKEMAQSENGLKPNIATYNTYINACACTEGDRAFKLAAIRCVFDALTELQENARLKPDNYTWPAIWKACMRLLDVKQDMQRLNMVFELCTRSGAINEHVFNNLRNFLPTPYLQKKLNTKQDVFTLTASDLPPEWTCNVKLKRQRGKSISNDSVNKL